MENRFVTLHGVRHLLALLKVDRQEPDAHSFQGFSGLLVPS
jgi:hypothetical protein